MTVLATFSLLGQNAQEPQLKGEVVSFGLWSLEDGVRKELAPK